MVWGLAFVVQKVGLEDSTPLWFAASRAIVAGLVLLPFWATASRIGVRGHLVAIVLGATNVAGFFGLQAAGIARVPPGTAAALVFTQPLIVTCLAPAFLGEVVTRTRYGGVMLALFGVACLGLPRFSAASALSGDALLLAAALSWAAGTIVLKRVSETPGWTLIAAQCAYGALMLVPLALVSGPLPRPTVRFGLAVLYTGVVATAGGWLLLHFLLRREGAAAVSGSLFAVPALGVLFSVALGDQPIRLTLVAGLALLATGMRIATAIR